MKEEKKMNGLATVLYSENKDASHEWLHGLSLHIPTLEILALPLM
jgi:hypothetical protein